ncbi:hypothetical protein BC830DRAFT_491547 [Chytriomyces sp. MP71]|nr:hypothetical protein BC830DRAFT_491547 [Chytriomyces sp. MP71]
MNSMKIRSRGKGVGSGSIGNAEFMCPVSTQNIWTMAIPSPLRGTPPPTSKRSNVVLPVFSARTHLLSWAWAQPPSVKGLGLLPRVLARARTAFIGNSKSNSSASNSLDSLGIGIGLGIASGQKPLLPQIPKIAVVGVHGWFPGWLIRNVVTGRPTGTSDKFAEKMEQGVRQYYLEKYNINLPPSAISSIALEGHGKVEDRVDKLYAQVMKPELGHAKVLQEADVIMVAAHSQGSPVSVMLFARMVREGLVKLDRQRVCILLMAGISHGPFPHLKSSIVVKHVEGDTARQLFDFNDPTSAISRRYHAAIGQVLNAGIRICAVGSWYDQVVPLYSSTLHAFNHPSILRAIHIEGADYEPDFLSHLVVFALRLRNAGLSDRGLLVYLSEFLAGNVYGFGTQGHSTVYEELDTYTLAFSWAISPQIPYSYAKMKKTYAEENHKPQCTNPYDPFDDFGSTPTHATRSHRARNSSADLLVPFEAGVSDPPPPFAPSRENPISDLLITADPTYHTQFAAPPGKLNPYWVPWILAQITSDPHVYANEHLRPHLDEVMRLFNEWEPVGKQLKELQYRLEPLRSRL